MVVVPLILSLEKMPHCEPKFKNEMQVFWLYEKTWQRFLFRESVLMKEN